MVANENKSYKQTDPFETYLSWLREEIKRVEDMQKRVDDLRRRVDIPRVLSGYRLGTTITQDHFNKLKEEGKLEKKIHEEDSNYTIKNGVLTYRVKNEGDFVLVPENLAAIVRLMSEKGVHEYRVEYTDPKDPSKVQAIYTVKVS